MKVAVITGGGGVLCSGFAKDLAKLGVKVAVLDLREEAARKVVDEITAEGGVALAVGCNVLEAESLENAKAKVSFAKDGATPRGEDNSETPIVFFNPHV